MSLSCDFSFSETCIQVRALDGFLRVMAQNAWNHARVCLSGIGKFNFNI